ncbi:MAG TPA: lipase family protein [Mycobacteriales bacterium]|nr:lipase family protein [Mycobacteriales bacterium]
MRRMGTIVAVALTIALTCPVPRVDGSPAVHAPQQADSFYSYSGDKPLSQIRPGTVLKKRTVQLTFGPLPTPVTTEQLLYRTTDQLGHATATVTTVIAPLPLPVQPDIVGYLSFYDDLGGTCAPSYTLTGGNANGAGGAAGGAANSQAEEEELLIAFYLAQGWVVTVPDFEGPHLHWMAGRESGKETLDGLRATESALGVTAATKIGLSGYSGGALAADWASELAPHYAPSLDLVGVAEGGIPVSEATLFRYANGTPVYSAALPGILVGLARAYHLPLHRYLSPYGKKVVRVESRTCMTNVFGKYPGLTYQKILKPKYRHIFKVRALARMIDAQHMGTVRGHPDTAFLMGNGDIDGYGDGVMSVRDVIGLADEYCAEGVPVEFHRYGGAGHEAAGIYFDPETAPFLRDRFAGLPFKGNCGSIRATG